MHAISDVEIKRSAWQTTIMFTVAFWLSSSLILDLVIMPSLYATGMMTQTGFATAGYTLFWIFNRIELLCAAIVLTGFLAIRGVPSYTTQLKRWPIVLSLLLLAIVLIYTYLLTPEMSALGMQLNLFDPSHGTPANMAQMQLGYWFLEALKLTIGATLVGFCYRRQL
jgi:hypothetical protein